MFIENPKYLPKSLVLEMFKVELISWVVLGCIFEKNKILYLVRFTLRLYLVLKL